MIVALLLCSYSVRLAQGDEGYEEELDYVGPKECPNDPSTIGYSNTTEMQYDMLSQRIGQEEDVENVEFKYVLCPHTEFRMGSDFNDGGEQNQFPISPLASNTQILCGTDGKLKNNCTLAGGISQIYFVDYIITENVTFSGITMTKNEGVVIYAHGNMRSSAVFKECLITENKGINIIHQFFDGNIDDFDRKLKTKTPVIDDHVIDTEFVHKGLNTNFFNYLDRVKSTVSYMDVQSLSNTVKSQRNLQEQEELSIFPGMHITFFATDIIDNTVEQSLIMNVNSITEVIDCDISYNNAEFAILATIFGGEVHLEESSFEKNSDDFGPIFVDKYSTITLTNLSDKENSGSGCDIFVEIEESNCTTAETYDTCFGRCCDFTSLSCDEVETDEAEVIEYVEEDTKDETASKYETPENVNSCGALCISLSVIFSLVGALCIALIGWKVYTRSQIEYE